MTDDPSPDGTAGGISFANPTDPLARRAQGTPHLVQHRPVLFRAGGAA